MSDIHEYIPKTPDEERAMLEAIGVHRFEDLLEIPESLRLNRPLALPPRLSEVDLKREMEELAAENNIPNLSFIGGGAYDHFIPSVVGHMISRSEFYTSYTPYQAEMSQGLLQSIYEFQTMICEIAGMEVANASLYDGASALSEAALMARRITRREKILVSRAVHPYARQVLKTYLRGASIVEIDLEDGATDLNQVDRMVDERTAALLLQQPNFFGSLEDAAAAAEIVHRRGAFLVLSVDPISLGVLAPPGALGADIAVGEGQPLGNSLSFGGPYFGFFATRREHIRQMPGRVVGATVNSRGERGFCLTLQTREQHIRRERSTSNICTNQALSALAATVYLAAMGPWGLKRVAEICASNAHYAAQAISKIEGFSLAYSRPFFKEFTLRVPGRAATWLARLRRRGIAAGIDPSALKRVAGERSRDPQSLIVCTTEKHRRSDIDQLVRAIADLSSRDKKA